METIGSYGDRSHYGLVGKPRQNNHILLCYDMQIMFTNCHISAILIIFLEYQGATVSGRLIRGD